MSTRKYMTGLTLIPFTQNTPGHGQNNNNTCTFRLAFNTVVLSIFLHKVLLPLQLS